jgi:hypothetical protein
VNANGPRAYAYRTHTRPRLGDPVVLLVRVREIPHPRVIDRDHDAVLPGQQGPGVQRVPHVPPNPVHAGRRDAVIGPHLPRSHGPNPGRMSGSVVPETSQSSAHACTRSRVDWGSIRAAATSPPQDARPTPTRLTSRPTDPELESASRVVRIHGARPALSGESLVAGVPDEPGSGA